MSRIMYSKGDGTFEIKDFVFEVFLYDERAIFSDDVNGDGFYDLLVYEDGGFDTYLFNPSVNIDVPFVKSGGRTLLSIQSSPSTLSLTRFTHGNTLVFIDRGQMEEFSYNRDETFESLLTASVSSFGLISHHEYRRIGEDVNFYKKGNDAVYPYHNLEQYGYVVSSQEAWYNNELKSKMVHSYENAVYHAEGLGFCGFAKVTTKDARTGRVYTDIFDPYRFGIKLAVEDEEDRIENEYNINIETNRKKHITLTKTTILNKEYNAQIQVINATFLLI